MSRQMYWDEEAHQFFPVDDVPQEPVKPTNADRIRAMSDEELSYLIADNVACNRRCKAWKEGCEYSDSTCRQAWLDWLKEEVEE